MFFCALPAVEGGYTPVADSREVYKRIDKKIIEKFNEHGIKYVRNYFPEIDLSWEEVFQSKDKNTVEQYCNNNSILFEWGSSSSEQEVELTTSQVCQATLSHPITKERVWFNQANLFHSSSLDIKDIAFFSEILGKRKIYTKLFFWKWRANIKRGGGTHYRCLFQGNNSVPLEAWRFVDP